MTGMDLRDELAQIDPGRARVAAPPTTTEVTS
jgi:hypothetical protein